MYSYISHNYKYRFRERNEVANRKIELSKNLSFQVRG